jgi:hypothetical protein
MDIEGLAERFTQIFFAEGEAASNAALDEIESEYGSTAVEAVLTEAARLNMAEWAAEAPPPVAGPH